MMIIDEVKNWILESRDRLLSGEFSEKDLQKLEDVIVQSPQKILYIYSKSTNMRSAIAGWSQYDPTIPHEPTLPSQEVPYESVLDAVADGWRIVQFPRPELRPFSDVDNCYLGYEFILERQ